MTLGMFFPLLKWYKYGVLLPSCLFSSLSEFSVSWFLTLVERCIFVNVFKYGRRIVTQTVRKEMCIKKERGHVLHLWPEFTSVWFPHTKLTRDFGENFCTVFVSRSFVKIINE